MHKPAAKNIYSALTSFAIDCHQYALVTESCGHLVNDSRQLECGDIFCAVIGHSLDGRKFIESAIQSGASMVLAECESPEQHGLVEQASMEQAAVIHFYQLNKHLFALAKAYYQSPQSAMTMIGITGTNGKTSTSQLVAQLINALAQQCSSPEQCAVIGTNGAGAVGNLKELANTTPSASELHQLFYQFAQQDYTHTAMEVSSHALEQGRVTGELFDIAVFTNLSRDHLDYHGSMENYAKAKRALFVGNDQQIAVVNGDDDQAKQWLNTWPAEQELWLFGLNEDIAQHKYYLQAKSIEPHHQGTRFILATHLGDIAINSPLLGLFNVENLLAAIAVVLASAPEKQGQTLALLANAVENLVAIPGRMEAFAADNKCTAVVDYAHSPDALEKALIACRKHCQGKLYAVFGCGGDRDKGKRPLMAKAAADNADYLVLTNDNPRTESEQSIIDNMLTGLDGSEQVSVILDRKTAVLSTLAKAQEGDVVLLAGKGHEDYVILGNKKYPYNERAIVEQYYQDIMQHNQSHTGEVKR
ncbi:UDP-N-acetylmuramoyl-L-alanyl-D-glutamate--2,6-diaminopimelate ligase [Litorilituus sediminis]|uniref:UDP-N-acetylmuramoyl-L-alanyl-D-glutamate--2,6-diaminopimelate ligase n=2 Tax=Litorilituus sediminis TaxID=718192 RepID=A0A4P6PDG4_9GAMM|nr:UDP-N-acetylmuramoyl-L-alanyl-D-glutamate--2,6-diaminopimelate ligase [Litorilituus sediminis]